MTAQFNNSGAAQRRPALVERRHLLPFALIACLFATWTFAASLNDVLIRHFQHALDISRTQSSFIQIAFYVGYFCAAIPAGLVIRRLGYKAGILAGLTLYALGAFPSKPLGLMASKPLGQICIEKTAKNAPNVIQNGSQL